MLELKAVEFLKELLGSYSPSGFEQEATRVFKDYCSKFAIEEFTDKMGNVAFTSIGMMGEINGWFIPISVHPICLGLALLSKSRL